MITLKELLNGHNIQFVPIAHQQNLEDLQDKLNKFRSAYGKPMVVTSGYRSEEEHLAIYKKKGITDKAKIPMKSKHLAGQACDFADPNADLWKFCIVNLSLCKSLGLWLEDPRWTHGRLGNWTHFQSVAPASGKRIFVPSTAPMVDSKIWDGYYAKLYD